MKQFVLMEHNFAESMTVLPYTSMLSCAMGLGKVSRFAKDISQLQRQGSTAQKKAIIRDFYAMNHRDYK
jgi:hypothetical protein